ncbi:hypothetical protein H696_03416 [Fonticula alba]|uniref:Plasma membrane fusion protein PRM1 n=1 Tax=Fonticula alba TaxID=691883 RepID=A0A058Z776_FONAL|nr:hypothetical protein H696_03416 [Fonticula alba]KCV69951.1 hypothetical protein H696_03416 [Fonticula alba]|eukprot:XP_009495557.1 hypothetical protein H696_03416 [Fonticula alba]
MGQKQAYKRSKTSRLAGLIIFFRAAFCLTVLGLGIAASYTYSLSGYLEQMHERTRSAAHGACMLAEDTLRGAVALPERAAQAIDEALVSATNAGAGLLEAAAAGATSGAVDALEASTEMLVRGMTCSVDQQLESLLTLAAGQADAAQLVADGSVLLARSALRAAENITSSILSAFDQLTQGVVRQWNDLLDGLARTFPGLNAPALMLPPAPRRPTFPQLEDVDVRGPVLAALAQVPAPGSLVGDTVQRQITRGMEALREVAAGARPTLDHLRLPAGSRPLDAAASMREALARADDVLSFCARVDYRPLDEVFRFARMVVDIGTAVLICLAVMYATGAGLSAYSSYRWNRVLWLSALRGRGRDGDRPAGQPGPWPDKSWWSRAIAATWTWIRHFLAVAHHPPSLTMLLIGLIGVVICALVLFGLHRAEDSFIEQVVPAMTASLEAASQGLLQVTMEASAAAAGRANAQIAGIENALAAYTRLSNAGPVELSPGPVLDALDLIDKTWKQNGASVFLPISCTIDTIKRVLAGLSQVDFAALLPRLAFPRVPEDILALDASAVPRLAGDGIATAASASIEACRRYIRQTRNGFIVMLIFGACVPAAAIIYATVMVVQGQGPADDPVAAHRRARQSASGQEQQQQQQAPLEKEGAVAASPPIPPRGNAGLTHRGPAPAAGATAMATNIPPRPPRSTDGFIVRPPLGGGVSPLTHGGFCPPPPGPSSF